MFKFKEENNDNLLKIIDQLREENNKLKNELNEVANNTGNCIIKQMPDGSMELNGIPFDNTSDVDYYNSAKATFSELTMFRVGKETKQREMDKLIKIHMDEVDELKRQILLLTDNTTKITAPIVIKSLYDLYTSFATVDAIAATFAYPIIIADVAVNPYII